MNLPKDSFRDRYGKTTRRQREIRWLTKMIKKKLGMKEDRRLYVETIAGLKKKVEKSGMTLFNIKESLR